MRAAALLVSCVIFLFLETITVSRIDNTSSSHQFREKQVHKDMLSDVILAGDHIHTSTTKKAECVPMRKSTLHSPEKTLQQEYQARLSQWCETDNPSSTITTPLESLMHVETNGSLSFHAVKRRFVSVDYDAHNSNDGGALLELHGDHVAYVGLHTSVFAHVVMDHLPFIAFLRKQLIGAKANAKLLLHQTGTAQRLLEWIDPDFVQERIVWMQPHQRIRVKNGTLCTIVNTNALFRHQQYFGALRLWVGEMKGVANTTAEARSAKHIVYITRNTPDAHHGRGVNRRHEADLIYIIQDSMKRHGRTESLVVFNGMKKVGGNLVAMTFDEQFELFQSVQTIIGGHGGAFANAMWMGRLDDDMCNLSGRPQVLEFLIGPGSYQVQRARKHGNNVGFRKTYYALYHSAPWVEYHHVLYAANSTRDQTYVNLTEFEQALDSMWG